MSQGKTEQEDKIEFMTAKDIIDLENSRGIEFCYTEPTHKNAAIQNELRQIEKSSLDKLMVVSTPALGKNQYGVVAKQKIEKGEIVALYYGKVLEDTTLKNTHYRYLVDSKKGTCFDATKEGSIVGRIVNHSNQPSLLHLLSKKEKVVKLVALRKINPNEEVYYDHTAEFFSETNQAMKFLHPTDWIVDNDLISKRPTPLEDTHYHQNPFKFNKNFLNFFGLNEDASFLVPKIVCSMMQDEKTKNFNLEQINKFCFLLEEKNKFADPSIQPMITPLMIACYLGNEKYIEFLVENGADVQRVTRDTGMPALGAAFWHDDDKIKKIKKCLGVKNYGNFERTLFFLAVRENKIKYAENYFKIKKFPDNVDHFAWMYPNNNYMPIFKGINLDFSLENAHIEMIKLLLEKMIKLKVLHGVVTDTEDIIFKESSLKKLSEHPTFQTLTLGQLTTIFDKKFHKVLASVSDEKSRIVRFLTLLKNRKKELKNELQEKERVENEQEEQFSLLEKHDMEDVEIYESNSSKFETQKETTTEEVLLKANDKVQDEEIDEEGSSSSDESDELDESEEKSKFEGSENKSGESETKKNNLENMLKEKEFSSQKTDVREGLEILKPSDENDGHNQKIDAANALIQLEKEKGVNIDGLSSSDNETQKESSTDETPLKTKNKIPDEELNEDRNQKINAANALIQLEKKEGVDIEGSSSSKEETHKGTTIDEVLLKAKDKIPDEEINEEGSSSSDDSDGLDESEEKSKFEENEVKKDNLENKLQEKEFSSQKNDGNEALEILKPSHENEEKNQNKNGIDPSLENEKEENVDIDGSSSSKEETHKGTTIDEVLLKAKDKIPDEEINEESSSSSDDSDGLDESEEKSKFEENEVKKDNLENKLQEKEFSSQKNDGNEALEILKPSHENEEKNQNKNGIDPSLENEKEENVDIDGLSSSEEETHKETTFEEVLLKVKGKISVEKINEEGSLSSDESDELDESEEQNQNNNAIDASLEDEKEESVDTDGSSSSEEETQRETTIEEVLLKVLKVKGKISVEEFNEEGSSSSDESEEKNKRKLEEDESNLEENEVKRNKNLEEKWQKNKFSLQKNDADNVSEDTNEELSLISNWSGEFEEKNKRKFVANQSNPEESVAKKNKNVEELQVNVQQACLEEKRHQKQKWLSQGVFQNQLLEVASFNVEGEDQSNSSELCLSAPLNLDDANIPDVFGTEEYTQLLNEFRNDIEMRNRQIFDESRTLRENSTLENDTKEIINSQTPSSEAEENEKYLKNTFTMKSTSELAEACIYTIDCDEKGNLSQIDKAILTGIDWARDEEIDWDNKIGLEMNAKFWFDQKTKIEDQRLKIVFIDPHGVNLLKKHKDGIYNEADGIYISNLESFREMCEEEIGLSERFSAIYQIYQCLRQPLKKEVSFLSNDKNISQQIISIFSNLIRINGLKLVQNTENPFLYKIYFPFEVTLDYVLNQLENQMFLKCYLHESQESEKVLTTIASSQVSKSMKKSMTPPTALVNQSRDTSYNNQESSNFSNFIQPQPRPARSNSIVASNFRNGFSTNLTSAPLRLPQVTLSVSPQQLQLSTKTNGSALNTALNFFSHNQHQGKGHMATNSVNSTRSQARTVESENIVNLDDTTLSQKSSEETLSVSPPQPLTMDEMFNNELRAIVEAYKEETESFNFN